MHPHRLPYFLVSTAYDFLFGLFRSAYTAVRGWSPIRKLVALAAVFLGVYMLFGFDVPSLATLQQWSLHLGPWFPFLFGALYVLVVQFPIPRTFFTLSSGVLFGPALGITVALVSTTVGAALSISIVRAFFGEWIAQRLTHPAVARIDRHLKQRGWLAVASLRMIAAVPFSILNYVAALSSVPILSFTVATLVGSAPGTIATVLLGNTLTGDMDPKLLAVALSLAVIGSAGLLIDAKVPLKGQDSSMD